MNTRPLENSDTVNLVCALLVRYPEIASIRSMPGEGTVRFTFAVAQRMDRATQRAAGDEIEAHVKAFLALARDGGDVSVECESERAHSFVHVTRDLDSFTRDELAMLTALFAQRFGAALVRNPCRTNSLMRIRPRKTNLSNPRSRRCAIPRNPRVWWDSGKRNTCSYTS